MKIVLSIGTTSESHKGEHGATMELTVLKVDKCCCCFSFFSFPFCRTTEIKYLHRGYILPVQYSIYKQLGLSMRESS